MRRSSQIIAPLLASTAALLLSGCGPEMQRCVDQQNHVVDPSFCKNLPAQQSVQQQNGPLLPYTPIYRYYYGGGGSYGFGSTVYGGSYSPEAGQSYSFTNGTSRGGFGESFSGGGGEGE
jgi:hypothetical protein